MLKRKRLCIFAAFFAGTIALLACSICYYNQNRSSSNSTNEYLQAYSVIDVKPNNGIMEEFYIDCELDIEVTEKVREFAENDEASDVFKQFFFDSDRIEFIPIFGCYLENTSLTALLFWKENQLIGTKTVGYYTGEPEKIVELSDVLDDTVYESTLSDDQCFLAIKTCLEEYPDFQLLGLVYNAVGFQAIYPIGIDRNKTYIEYYTTELCVFRLIDTFSTVSDGRSAFDRYWTKKAEILSSIPIFEWTTQEPYGGYINQYRYQDIYKLGFDQEKHEYLYTYDAAVIVPLLDSEGTEDKYILHLLYYHNELIAELILEKTNNGIIPAKERIASKDMDTNRYVPLTSISYVEKVNHLLLQTDSSRSIKGIGFDGVEYLLIYK